jgi:hypothetical protein
MVVAKNSLVILQMAKSFVLTVRQRPIALFPLGLDFMSVIRHVLWFVSMIVVLQLGLVDPLTSLVVLLDPSGCTEWVLPTFE